MTAYVYYVNSKTGKHTYYGAISSNAKSRAHAIKHMGFHGYKKVSANQFYKKNEKGFLRVYKD